jgi:hypothetical protein
MLQVRMPAFDEPVTALNGHSAGGTFRYWRGQSGRRYLHTVHTLADWPGYCEANVIFARPRADGGREAMWIGRISATGSEMRAGGLIDRMAGAGASEIHVHLLAGSEAERRAIERDLKRATGQLRALD